MENNTPVSAPPFSIRDKVGYLFGDFGNDFFFIMVSSFLMVYYTKVLGIRSSIVGVLFVVARCVDAFTDIGMGRLIDSLPPTKQGRFRPWILWVMPFAALSGFLLFAPFCWNFSLTGKMIYIFITYIFWGSFCYTAINIPYGSMASALSSDPIDRNSLSTFRSLGAGLASMVIMFVVPQIVYRYDAAGNQVVIPARFPLIAGIFAIAALICYALCYKMTTERVIIAKPQAERGATMRVVRGMVSNRALGAIILAALVLLIALLLTQTLNAYLFMDRFKNIQAQSVSGVVGVACTFILAPFSNRIAEKIGKKEACSAALVFAGLVYLAAWFMNIQSGWIWCAVFFFGNLGTGLFNLMIWAMITDVIDQQELISGSRDDGTIYAVYSFARKIGQAVAGGLGAAVLGIIGYVETAPAQAPQVIQGLYFWDTVIPALCFFLIAAILIFLYPLSRKKVAENVAQLKKLRSK